MQTKKLFFIYAKFLLRVRIWSRNTVLKQNYGVLDPIIQLDNLYVNCRQMSFATLGVFYLFEKSSLFMFLFCRPIYLFLFLNMSFFMLHHHVFVLLMG